MNPSHSLTTSGHPLTLCRSCSKLDFASLTRPPIPCRKPLPCDTALEDEDIIVHAEEENPKHLPLGSLDEIRSRRYECGLCSLVADCLDQEPSDAAGTCRLIEHTEICSFELPDGFHASAPTFAHFHYTRPSVLFDPSSTNNFQGPVLPWELKRASKNRAQRIIQFQIKANNKGHSTSRSEEQNIIDGLGGRQVTEQVDAYLLKTWLHLCEDHHGPQCREPMRFPSTQETGPALVIDVTESCIIDTPLSCRYVALSYVWGSASVFRHLKENSERIRKPGSLEEVQLPDTIRDSMLLVREIGERYLWVDSICIIQDDFKTQQSQIQRMGSIYSKAIFTIVVAFGDGANSGLPGIRPGTRKQVQKKLCIADNELLTVIDNDDVNEGIEDSIWAMRAWTFQERLLSKRVLVFTETQIYWNCRSAVFSEEFAAEQIKNVSYHHLSIGQSYLHRDIPDQELAPGEFCELYLYICAAYLQRRLTYQSDILNAFAGIAEILSMRQNDIFIWGLPQAHFSDALTWRFTGYHTRHGEKIPIMTPNGHDPENISIPSWSWAAWSGEGNLPWLGTGWLNPWAPNGIETTAVINFNIVGNAGKLVRIQERLPATHGHTKSERLLAMWRDFDHRNDTLGHCCDITLSIGQIHCWTSMARLRVVRKEVEKPQSSECDIYLAEDDPDLPADEWFLSGMKTDSTSHIHGEILEPNSKLRALKSETYSSGVDLIWLDFVVVAKTEAYDSESASLKLLAVEWKDGVAHRLGLASILEPAWISVKNRQWRHVVLG